LHATSNGKVLLSGLDGHAQDVVLGELPAYTERTITKSATLLAEVAEVRERGYALAVDELEVGLTAAAAPIRNAHGDVIASISVSGPTFRMPPERVEKIVGQVLEAAREVSYRLGWSHRNE